jgi:hypothetical protein
VFEKLSGADNVNLLAIVTLLNSLAQDMEDKDWEE